MDKLGGPGWEKVKTKVRSHLRDVAAELLDIYSKRATCEAAQLIRRQMTTILASKPHSLIRKPHRISKGRSQASLLADTTPTSATA